MKLLREATQSIMPKARRNWREILICLGAVFLPGFIAATLMAISSVPPPAATAESSVGLTDAEPAVASAEDMDLESKAEVTAREKRLRDIELQLVAAHRQEEKAQRYQQSFADGITIETSAGTSVFAFGRPSDLVSVSCEQTEFGQVATLSTSAEPSVFFVARYLSGCVAGELPAGTEIGMTMGPLGWEQRNQLNGAAEEPSEALVEWALSGYAGEHAAPIVRTENLRLDEMRDALKSFFTEPME